MRSNIYIYKKKALNCTTNILKYVENWPWCAGVKNFDLNITHLNICDVTHLVCEGLLPHSASPAPMSCGPVTRMSICIFLLEPNKTTKLYCFDFCFSRPLCSLCTTFFLSTLTGSIWFPDPCVIPLSSFVRSRTNSIVHGDCFHWFFHCPPSHKSNMYCALPYSPSYTRLLPNNVTLLRGTRGYPRAAVGIWPIWDTHSGRANISLCVNSPDEPHTN